MAFQESKPHKKYVKPIPIPPSSFFRPATNSCRKQNEAIDILTDFGYVVDNIPTDTVQLDLEPQETENVEAYDIDINNPVCPCCGKRLYIVNTNVETDEFIGESTKLNERWENEYLTNQVQDIANQLFEPCINFSSFL